MTANYISYNFQTLRDDVFMLARDGNVTGNRIGPARSSCAIHVGSYNANRESIYFQQQTISGEGLSGIAFSTNVPHTVRGTGRHQEMHRLPRLEEQRQQRHHGPAADAGHQLRQLHRPLLLGGGRRARPDGGGGDRARGAAGGDRQPPAQSGVPGRVSQAPATRRPAGDRPRASRQGHRRPAPAPGRRSRRCWRCRTAANTCTRPAARAACGSSTSPSSTTRAFPSGSPRRRFRRWARSSTCRRSYCHRGRLADDDRPRPDAEALARRTTRRRSHALYGELYAADKYEGLILIGAGTLLDGNPPNNFL